MSGGAVIGEMYKTGFEVALNDWYRRRTEHREDTAVQRRVKDLVAAGLSPTLAAGSAASTSGPIQVRGPDLGTAIGQAENTAVAEENSRISRMNANTQLKQARIALLRGAADIATTHAQLQLLEQQKRKVKAEADVAEHDASIYTTLPTPSTFNPGLFGLGAYGSLMHGKMSQLAEKYKKEDEANAPKYAQEAARKAAAKAAKAASNEREARAKAAKGAHGKAANRMIDLYIDQYDREAYRRNMR